MEGTKYMENIVEMSRIYCMAAHDAVGQRRKYSDEPYWVHPIEVAELIKAHGFDNEVIAAAHLHDVVEDTGITLDQIRSIFGSNVETYVENVTDISKPEDGNRKTRKLVIDLGHLAQATYEGKSIKLADLYSNTKSIVENDPGFARVYLKEKEAYLTQALYDGHPYLLEMAWDSLKEAKAKLGFNKAV